MLLLDVQSVHFGDTRQVARKAPSQLSTKWPNAALVAAQGCIMVIFSSSIPLVLEILAKVKEKSERFSFDVLSHWKQSRQKLQIDLGFSGSLCLNLCRSG